MKREKGLYHLMCNTWRKKKKKYAFRSFKWIPIAPQIIIFTQLFCSSCIIYHSAQEPHFLLPPPENHRSWEDVEFILRCIQMIHVLEDTWNFYLERVFPPAVLTINYKSSSKQNKNKMLVKLSHHMHPTSSQWVSALELKLHTSNKASSLRAPSGVGAGKEMSDDRLVA